MAGNLYYSELARQLSDFLDKLLPLSSGILSLADVYCLFNRARGIELVSPEDLYKACCEFERLNLPMKLKKFDTGLLVVQSLKYTEELVTEKVLTYLKEKPWITCLDLADIEKTSTSLALEQLLVYCSVILEI